MPNKWNDYREEIYTKARKEDWYFIRDTIWAYSNILSMGFGMGEDISRRLDQSMRLKYHEQ